MDRPEVGSVAEEVYAGLAAWQRADEGRWDLLNYVGALMQPLQEIVDLASDTDTHPGWARLLDVNAAPAYALGWLAQFVGVRRLRGLSEENQRLRIREAGGFHRGSPAAIRAAARQFLTGKQQVDLFERDNGNPWRFRIRTYRAETPDPRAVYDAVLALKPAGLIFTHEVQNGISIDEMTEGTIDGYPQTIDFFNDTVPTDVIEFGTAFGAGAYGEGPYGGGSV